MAAAGGARTVALVNDPGSPLAVTCQHVLPLHAGQEASVAATKSYIASLSALLQLVAAWQDDRPLLDALGRLPAALDAETRPDWTDRNGGVCGKRVLVRFDLGWRPSH